MLIQHAEKRENSSFKRKEIKFWDAIILATDLMTD